MIFYKIDCFEDLACYGNTFCVSDSDSLDRLLQQICKVEKIPWLEHICFVLLDDIKKRVHR